MNDDGFRPGGIPGPENEEPWFLSDDDVSARVRLIVDYATRAGWNWKVSSSGIRLCHPITGMPTYIGADDLQRDSSRLLESTLWLLDTDAEAGERASTSGTQDAHSEAVNHGDAPTEPSFSHRQSGYAYAAHLVSPFSGWDIGERSG